MQALKSYFSLVGDIIEAVGVFIIAVGAIISVAQFFHDFKGGGFNDAYQNLRKSMGRAILLGLEFLIAGDIIDTVAVSQTLQSVLVLAVVVLIRTFLSIAIHGEVEGRWPWQRPA